MKNIQRVVGATAVATLGLVLLGATSCDESPATDKAQAQREAKSKSVVLCGEKGESLECRNLAAKRKRDEDPTRITYVYLLSWTGEFIGYYVAKGKVSSNQSQMGPMDTVIYDNVHSYNGGNVVVEAPGDDGSFGPNEDGIFFFTADDNKITWNGMYQQSDYPLAIKAPLLYVAKS